MCEARSNNGHNLRPVALSRAYPSEGIAMTEAAGCVAIEILTVPAERRSELLDLLSSAGTIIAEQPGFLGTALLAGHDADKIAVHARWQSLDDLLAWRARPESAAHRAELQAIVTHREGGTFELVGGS